MVYRGFKFCSIRVQVLRNRHRRNFCKNNCVATETFKIPSREDCILSLKSGKKYDVLIVGGGSTGTGAAVDAATRGLSVACLEREDFSSGTSSRSTKLIWGGSRYLVQALVSLFHYDCRLIRTPRKTIRRFLDEFRMVLNCHRERKFLLKTQDHLTNWLPIAVPLTKWFIWPPPFGYPPAALGPLGVFSLFFWFYDSLSGFSCPPSHIMTRNRAIRKFPQLANNKIIYSPVFYEGQHDDARTNLAIALTAAKQGADIANYCNVIELLRDADGKVNGAIVQDTISGESFPIHAKSVLFCGGPFTDELRKLEDANINKAVSGASGIHIVLPSYYAPSAIGLVDMNTSDGRFLFFLPWMGHVLVGTTDRPEPKPSMRPEPEETEISWLLNEASKYLHPELMLRRQDVLSAWSGIRPLAIDPYASSSHSDSSAAPVSRDHIISHSPKTGVVFISGGKWTTYREMAQDAIDKIIEVAKLTPKNPSSTLTLKLVGSEGYSNNLAIKLIQEFGLSLSVAQRLARAYGGRAYDVCTIASKEMKFPQSLQRLVQGYPYLEAEVIFAARHDWARHADDVIARRTRLAFLNKEVSLLAIPRVVELMAQELRWDEAKQKEEVNRCVEYMRHFGGPRPSVSASTSGDSQHPLPRISTEADIADAMKKLNIAGKMLLGAQEVRLAGELLGRPLSEEEVVDCLQTYATSSRSGSSSDNGSDCQVTQEHFAYWWNSSHLNPTMSTLRQRNMASSEQIEGSGSIFG